MLFGYLVLNVQLTLNPNPRDPLAEQNVFFSLEKHSA